MFNFIALIDFRVDVNILNTKVILAKYWMTVERKVIGLGSKKLKYEIPMASICFDSHCIKLKFVVADIPIDCILGNIFLAAVEPNGSFRTKKNKSGYFITLPTSLKGPRKIKLPYVLAPRVSIMVQTMEELKKAESKLTDLKDLKSTIHILQ